MTVHKCPFCNNDFHDKTTLNRHQKSAKFCLGIQEEKGIVTNPDSFNCTDCGKVFTLKRVLTKHISTCKKLKYTKQEPLNLHKESSKFILLEEYMKTEFVKTIFRGCTLEEYLEFTPASIIDKIIPLLNGVDQPIYYCSDRSRQRFFHVDNCGNTEDMQAMTLRTLIYNGMYSVFGVIHSNRLIYIESEISRCRRLKEDGDRLLKSWRTDRDILLAQFERLNILKNHKDYLVALSKKLPVKTERKITTIKPLVFDYSRVRMLTHEIGGYNLSELMCYREKYIKNKIETNPPDFSTEINRKEYTAFLKATDEELLERYGK